MGALPSYLLPLHVVMLTLVVSVLEFTQLQNEAFYNYETAKTESWMVREGTRSFTRDQPRVAVDALLFVCIIHREKQGKFPSLLATCRGMS